MTRALYVAYFTGVGGNSQGLFYISDDLIAGIDIGGMRYDGRLSPKLNGGWEGLIEFTLSSGQTLITGASGGSTPQKIAVSLSLPPDFAEGAVVRIETPLGPVNAKFEMLKDLSSS